MYMRYRLAISLVELIVVIFIVALLLGLLFPAVVHVRESSRQIQCSSNLRQLGIASQAMVNLRGELPNNRLRLDENDVAVEEHLWMHQIRPMLEIAEVGNALQASPNPVLRCPSGYPQQVITSIPRFLNGVPVASFEAGTVDYVGCAGINSVRNLGMGMENADRQRGFVSTIVGNQRATKASEVTDGNSNTIAFWESYGGMLAEYRGGALYEFPLSANESWFIPGKEFDRRFHVSEDSYLKIRIYRTWV